MKALSWTVRVGVALMLGATLAGCCVAPVAPYGPRYGGRVVYEPAPVVVAPVVPVVPMHRHWGWYR